MVCRSIKAAKLGHMYVTSFFSVLLPYRYFAPKSFKKNFDWLYASFLLYAFSKIFYLWEILIIWNIDNRQQTNTNWDMLVHKPEVRHVDDLTDQSQGWKI